MINAASVSKAAIIGAILAHKKPWSWKNRMLALFFVNDKRKGRKHIQPGDEWRVYDNANEDDIFLRGRATGDRRRDITAKLQHEGILRPAHAQCNSRM